MKTTLIIATLLACLSTTAQADNYTPPKTPEPTPAPTATANGQQGQGQGQHQGQGQDQGQGQGQNQGQATDVDANGTGTGTGTGSGYGASAINSKSSSFFINFPQPVWATVPGAKGECIVSFAESEAWVWAFHSEAKNGQRSDVPCALEKMFVSAMNNCHFESAEMIRNRSLAILTPGLPDLPLTPGVRNLKHDECEALKRPRLVMTGNITPPAPPAAPVQPEVQACVAPPATPLAKRITKSTAKTAEKPVAEVGCKPAKKEGGAA